VRKVGGALGLFGLHVDGAAGAFGGAQAASRAVVVVDRVLAVGELDDGVVGADADLLKQSTVTTAVVITSSTRRRRWSLASR